MTRQQFLELNQLRFDGIKYERLWFTDTTTNSSLCIPIKFTQAQIMGHVQKSREVFQNKKAAYAEQ